MIERQDNSLGPAHEKIPSVLWPLRVALITEHSRHVLTARHYGFGEHMDVSVSCQRVYGYAVQQRGVPVHQVWTTFGNRRMLGRTGCHYALAGTSFPAGIDHDERKWTRPESSGRFEGGYAR